MDFAVIESTRDGGWAVEAIDLDGDGEVFRALFTGPADEARARHYANVMNGLSNEPLQQLVRHTSET